MFRILLATALIATFGITGASAAGRSKDERASWWQTMRESKQAMGQRSAGSSGKTTAPAAATKAPAAAKPAQ